MPLDEGIPPSVECQRLSELKKVVHDHTLNEGPEVPKGSATSLAREYSDVNMDDSETLMTCDN